MEARGVWISSKHSNIKKLFITKRNKITITYLQAIFPKATTIEYNNIVLEPVSGAIELVENVCEYQVVYPANFLLEPKSGSGGSFIRNERQKKQLRKALDRLSGVEELSDDSSESEMKATEPKKKKFVPKKKLKSVKIHVGWKHQYKHCESFKLMTDEIGGIKYFTLDKPGTYTYSQILHRAVEAMKSEHNEHYFDKAISTFIDSFTTKFVNFVNDNSKECDFWEFATNFKVSNHTVKIYLHTSDNEFAETTTKTKEKISKSENYGLYIATGFVKNETLNLSTNQDEQNSTSNMFFASSTKSDGSLTSSTSYVHCKIADEAKSVSATQSKQEKSHLRPSVNFKVPDMPQAKINLTNDSDNGCDDTDVLCSLKKLRLSVPIISIEEMKSLDKMIGRGSQGVVKKARWNDTDVAVKKVKVRVENKYVYREITCMDKIRHPNVISIMAVAADDYEFSIIMEYFEDVDLRQLIQNEDIQKQYGVNSDTEKWFILKQICRTVNFLHRFKPQIVHKDLKPDNILVDKSLKVKICDLGLCHYETTANELHTTIGNNFHGTVGYMAPEIMLDNLKGEPESDVWSLACVIVELYNGDLWETGGLQMDGRAQHVEKLMKQRRTPHYDSVPIQLIPILDKCFQYEPEKRPSAAELLQVLETLT